MKPTAHYKMSSACLPRHPAVAYLFLVRWYEAFLDQGVHCRDCCSSGGHSGIDRCEFPCPIGVQAYWHRFRAGLAFPLGVYMATHIDARFILSSTSPSGPCCNHESQRFFEIIRLGPSESIFYSMLLWSVFVAIFFGFLVPWVLRRKSQSHLTNR
jgi:hypothetical protein